MHIFGGLTGNFYLCCHAEFQTNTTIVGTYDQSLGDIWNSDQYKKTRLDFLKNKIPTECIKACYDKEKLRHNNYRLAQVVVNMLPFIYFGYPTDRLRLVCALV